MSNGETRGRLRSQYDTTVKIKWDHKNEIVCEHSKDISLNGIYVMTRTRIDINTPVELEIMLNNHIAHIILKISGKIIRQDEGGLGINFNEMDIDSYQHLKNLVLYNSTEPSEVSKQCKDRPGFR